MDVKKIIENIDSAIAAGKHKSRQVKKVCAECGSDEVVKDAWAFFNTETQEWELENFFDYEFCKRCNGECTITEETI